MLLAAGARAPDQTAWRLSGPASHLRRSCAVYQVQRATTAARGRARWSWSPETTAREGEDAPPGRGGRLSRRSRIACPAVAASSLIANAGRRGRTARARALQIAKALRRRFDQQLTGGRSRRRRPASGPIAGTTHGPAARLPQTSKAASGARWSCVVVNGGTTLRPMGRALCCSDPSSSTASVFARRPSPDSASTTAPAQALGTACDRARCAGPGRTAGGGGGRL